MTIVRRLVATLALAAVALVAFASPASAAPPNTCTNSSVCGYVDLRYQTTHGWELIPTGGAGRCESVSLRNSWTSVYNNSGRTIRMYKQVGCTGEVWTLSSGDSLSDMSLYQPSWNDNIESIKFV